MFMLTFYNRDYKHLFSLCKANKIKKTRKCGKELFCFPVVVNFKTTLSEFPTHQGRKYISFTLPYEEI